MEDRTAWNWIIGILIAVVGVIGFLWLLNITTGDQGGMASSTSPTASTSPTNPTGAATSQPAPVKIVNNGSSIAAILATLTGDSIYTSLFDSTGVGATLGKGPYTVFVSTNAGFNLLPAGTVSKMTAAEKKRFVQYSIVSGRALDINAVNSGSVQTLAGDTVQFHVGSTGLVQVNSSYALGAFKASNGIIYILNQPLLPPQKSKY